MMIGHRVLFTVLALVSLLPCLAPGAAGAQGKPRAVTIVPYAASSLAADDQWMGEAVAQVLSRGLAQHPGFVEVERTGLDPSAWDEAAVRGLATRAEVVLFGRISQKGTDVIVEPRMLDVNRGQSTSLTPMTFDEGAFATGIAALPVAYARALRVPLSSGYSVRMEKAARLTPSLQALKLFTQAQMAADRGAFEEAVTLLVRAIEIDKGFVVASYVLGTVHAALQNRWKAAAQFRASMQLDPSMPEPIKALGDLFVSPPRQLFDQAIEAYSRAIDLRPFYSDAHARLGEVYARKGLCAESAKAYRRAAELNPWSTRPMEPCTPSRP